jgi:protein-L-isoaspartate O-methyltransferase
VSVPDWPERARRLADQLTADGDLRTPAWREALLKVPRHEFVPHYYELDTSSRPAAWTRHEPRDAASTARWLELVYSPATLVTELADYAGRGVQTGVVSSTKPDLMIRMLEALQVGDGMRILEIGTGTGYNAALLCHRLGGAQVCSIDIDPALITQASARLAELGYHPTLLAADGAEGLPGLAPFDRIIATCSVRAIPPAWIHQLPTGGLLLVHLEGPLGDEHAIYRAALQRIAAREEGAPSESQRRRVLRRCGAIRRAVEEVLASGARTRKAGSCHLRRTE